MTARRCGSARRQQKKPLHLPTPIRAQPPRAAPRQPPSASFEFHTDKWAELYSSASTTLSWRSRRGAYRSFGWDYGDPRRQIDNRYELSRRALSRRADKAGIAYVDIWDGFVDDQGRYVQDGPDFEGQTRRLRTYDGVYFTKAGAEKLGHYVEHDLRRVLSSHALPVALPGPEEQPPASDNVAGRPPRPSRASKCDRRRTRRPTFGRRKPSS